MNENIPQKFIPRETKLVLLLVFLIFLLALTVSEALEIKDKLKIKETITFSGEGKTIGIPDVSLINLSVITEKMTAEETTEENAKKMNEVIKFVKESGIDEKDVKTQSYQLSPRYDWIEGKRVFRGYQLISTLSVKIRNLEKISAIIDGAILKGANQVGDIQFVIDDPEKLKEEARLKAIENAKEKAKSIALATGLKLGKIVNFSETVPEVYPYPVFREAELGMGGEGKLVIPTIEKGSQEISVNVYLTFELK